MTGSKFSGLKAMREKRHQETEAPSVPEAAPDVTPVSEPPKRKVGRPPGKRSNPEYQQVTVLLHGQTYLEVRKRLLDQRTEVSDLINDLLNDWLNR
ncbi:hypothetical protein HNQ07_002142 [Deinococcus metalli]|uniref:Uncharacterized protein n=1 Tax=Deinococcus metalli TaxID=1141878 RepID=A0A7W8KF96_9DEIO|nr:hypothetical protein [Deinococcus metalli]MBB5376678.1 hypothetical protein [Deinococcus metalli]GHF42288.1 hypothetical protein GCM10017781_18220 [Deinococcus metalli]